jgi:mycofactocin system glycosyltransferase
VTQRPAAFPPGVPLVLDHRTHLVAGGRVLIGGDPPRAVRLSAAGAEALARLRTTGAVGGPEGAGVASDPARRLARTLVDGGLAHPRPEPDGAASVTVVVPVRDRPEALDACLRALTGSVVVVVDDGSTDRTAIAEVCARHDARLVRRAVGGGPAAARNAALAEVATDLVAFLDSDCIAPAGWLEGLLGHLADPLVGAVAPRVAGVRPPNRPTASFGPGVGPVARYAAARSPLDLGPWPARVRPGGRVAYVPSAALVVRRSALGQGFDATLRYGEDVDLVWRLHDAGWRVRYEPGVVVGHREPRCWRTLVGRRFHYGTSSAPLAARHPGRLAPFIVHPWSLAVVVSALAGRPRAAAAILAGQSLLLARKLGPLRVPARYLAAQPLRGAEQTAVSAGRTATMLALPALIAAGCTRRGRRPALALVIGPPLVEWRERRPRLDPIRWVALSVADDIAYGAGVWWGSLQARTLVPVRPTRAAAPR